jgi:hypothetical protein
MTLGVEALAGKEEVEEEAIMTEVGAGKGEEKGTTFAPET